MILIELRRLYPGGDCSLERFGLAYAHDAQGVTTAHGIVMMSAGEPKLALAKTLLVIVLNVQWFAIRA